MSGRTYSNNNSQSSSRNNNNTNNNNNNNINNNNNNINNNNFSLTYDQRTLIRMYQAFYDNILDQYFQSANQYFVKYTNLKRQRKVEDLIKYD